MMPMMLPMNRVSPIMTRITKRAKVIFLYSLGML
jgi:hypothetical protein